MTVLAIIILIALIAFSCVVANDAMDLAHARGQDLMGIALAGLLPALVPSLAFFAVVGTMLLRG